MHVLIKHLDVTCANARPLHWAVAITPVIPAVQFGHALGRALGANRLGRKLAEGDAAGGVYPVAVRVVHHASRVLGDDAGGSLAVQKRRTAGPTLKFRQEMTSGGQNTVGRTSDQPSVNANMIVSLVLEFSDTIDDADCDAINGFLDRARFAGGQIVGTGGVSLHPTLMDALTALGGGFLLEERRDLIDPDDPLGSMMRALYDDKPTLAKDEPDPNAWLAPGCLGYVLAEQPTTRGGVRGGGLHAYCEPMAGLVQYRAVRACLDTETAPAGWRGTWLNPGTWVVTQDIA